MNKMVFQKAVKIIEKDKWLIESKANKKYRAKVGKEQIKAIDWGKAYQMLKEDGYIWVEIGFGKKHAFLLSIPDPIMLPGTKREQTTLQDHISKPTICVTCSDCQERFNEEKVEIYGIEEGFRGEDVVTFKCPLCGKDQKSLRIVACPTKLDW